MTELTQEEQTRARQVIVAGTNSAILDEIGKGFHALTGYSSRTRGTIGVVKTLPTKTVRRETLITIAQTIIRGNPHTIII